MPGAPVGMFPEQAVIFFVNAHGIFNCPWRAIASHEVRIDIPHLADAITAER